MRIVVGTYNVRGLCSRAARSRLKNVIREIKPSLDILTIQEHKLRENNINFLTSTLWPQATLFNLPAANGTYAERNPLVTGGRGGVLLAVSPAISPLIVNHGTLPLQSGLWIHLDLQDGTKLGVAAVYAPHTSAERALLWEALHSFLHDSRKWIMAGDLNMITSSFDQAGGSPRPITGDEKMQWTTLIQAGDFNDTFKRREGILKFSWDNRRAATLIPQQGQHPLTQDNGQNLKRLDRIYADSSLIQNAQSSEILTGSDLSDHCPVIFSLLLGNDNRHKNSCYRMNTETLKDPKLRDHLTQLWGEWQRRYEEADTPPLQTLRGCIKRAAKYCQLWGKKLAAQRKEKHRRLSLKVQGMMLQLQVNPANVYIQLKLEAAQMDLSSWEGEKARWIQKQQDSRWEEDGERTTKLFFNSVAARKQQTLIHALKDNQGTLHTDHEEIMEMATDYFAEILQEPPSDPQQQLDTDALLSHMQAQVTLTERTEMQKAFTAEELLTAAKLLGRNKCPGPDGVPLEFFLTYWDTVSPLILRATLQGFQSGAILPFFNKAIQLRLAPVLQRLISWEQNAFVPGRMIHSTVLLCNEAIFEAKQTRQDAVLLKIDFKKAFDTLRWDFLYTAMRQMQFGEIFISLVKTLNNNASSCVRINGNTSKAFQISRSVRQGCPLSPLLFTLAIQVLTDAVNSLMRNGQLKGIDLTKIGVQYIQGYFADDSHFLLAADRYNLFNAERLLQTFGSASGLKVEWAKSKARWIATQPTRPQWTAELDWIWATDQKTDKFLGFHFQDGIDVEATFEALFQKIQKKVNSLKSRSTSIHGRVLIANHIIYGLVWFLLPLWAAGKDKLRKIEALVLRFIWGGTVTTKTGHRVAERILHQRKSEGGLGLISLQAQAYAFVAKTIRAYTPGTHPLKDWMLANFEAIAKLRWNTSHYTSAAGGSFARLQTAGIHEIGDISADGSTAKHIQLAIDPALRLTPAINKAFDKIIETTPKHTASYRCASLFMTAPAGNPLWCIRLNEDAPREDASITITHAKAAFQVAEDSKLLPIRYTDLPPLLTWARAPVATIANTQNRPPTRYLLRWEDKRALIAAIQ
ncbi:hypothetical protein R1sor_000600 [Riccia sorocarpa]|uniref:Reverse transcriptase domain-containing protein n=1 Tax=Riccia sorocarpa TaxID=122646 RepID=A0ABD3GTL3_9MARC